MKITPRGALSTSLAALAWPAARARAKPPEGDWKPQLSENLADVKPATLRWLKQLGCEHVIFQGTDDVDPQRKGYWTRADVERTMPNCDEAGLVLESMMIPIDFYKQARFGAPGRDEEIEKVSRTIRAVGETGVPMMEWRFWPDVFARLHARAPAGGERGLILDFGF